MSKEKREEKRREDGVKKERQERKRDEEKMGKEQRRKKGYAKEKKHLRGNVTRLTFDRHLSSSFISFHHAIVHVHIHSVPDVLVILISFLHLSLLVLYAT